VTEVDQLGGAVEVQAAARGARNLDEDIRGVGRHLVARKRRLRDQADALQSRLDEIHALQEQIALMAACDPLTGVLNRDHIDEALLTALSQARAADTTVALLMVDIDLLKQVNEEYGLMAGDALLKAVGVMLKDGLPEGASAGRYDADNFLVVLPGHTATSAHELAESYRLQMAANPVTVDTQSVQATLSVGVAEFPQDNKHAEGLIECLNLALFLAKHDGYNRVVAYNAGQSEVF
jgi:diguanylate cyclase (GGDEF)-like protein